MFHVKSGHGCWYPKEKKKTLKLYKNIFLPLMLLKALVILKLPTNAIGYNIKIYPKSRNYWLRKTKKYYCGSFRLHHGLHHDIDTDKKIHNIIEIFMIPSVWSDWANIFYTRMLKVYLNIYSIKYEIVYEQNVWSFSPLVEYILEQPNKVKNIWFLTIEPLTVKSQSKKI